MGTIYLLLILGVPIYAQNTDNKLQDFVHNRCHTNNPNSQTYDQLMNKFSDLNAYLDHTASLLPREKRRFCSEEKPKLSSATKVLMNTLKTCLYQSERFLPDFLADSFDGALLFVCENHGANVDNFFSSQGESCRNMLANASATIETQNCFQRIFPPTKGSIDKEQLCQNIGIAEKCFDVVIDKYCNNFLAYKTLNRRFFHRITKPCRSLAVFPSLSSTLFLICSIFYVLQFWKY